MAYLRDIMFSLLPCERGRKNTLIQYLTCEIRLTYVKHMYIFQLFNDNNAESLPHCANMKAFVKNHARLALSPTAGGVAEQDRHGITLLKE